MIAALFSIIIQHSSAIKNKKSSFSSHPSNLRTVLRDNPVELFEPDILFDGLNVETLENIKMKEQ